MERTLQVLNELVQEGVIRLRARGKTVRVGVAAAYPVNFRRVLAGRMLATTGSLYCGALTMA